MTIDNRDIYFNTGNNYLKRFQVYTGTYSAYTPVNFTHNLGYLPAVRVFYQSNGYMFEAYGFSGSSGLPNGGGSVSFELNTTQIQCYCNPPSGGSISVICIVYVDDLAT